MSIRPYVTIVNILARLITMRTRKFYGVDIRKYRSLVKFYGPNVKWFSETEFIMGLVSEKNRQDKLCIFTHLNG
jgi:hypothetical protein